jgi:hypothetical protein
MKSILRLLPWCALIAVSAAIAAGGRSGVADDEFPPAAGGEGGGDPAAPYTSPRKTNRGDTTAEDASLPGGDRLVTQAVRQLKRRASVTARLRHQVSLGRNQFVGVGNYCQQGQEPELQVRLELQFVGAEASLIQATNGRFLWTDRRLPTGRVITCVELHELRRVLQAENLVDDPAAAHGEVAGGDGLSLTAEEGGLPGLLASLVENFRFLPPQAMRLSLAAPLVTEPVELPVFAVVGHWRPEKLAPLVGLEGASPSAIPERFPQEVLLLVGQADLFPYRIEYRELETPVASGDSNETIVYRLSPSPIAVLELTDVVFDAAIPAAKFDYAPGTADFTDETALHLERILKVREARLTRKREDVRASPQR